MHVFCETAFCRQVNNRNKKFCMDMCPVECNSTNTERCYSIHYTVRQTRLDPGKLGLPNGGNQRYFSRVTLLTTGMDRNGHGTGMDRNGTFLLKINNNFNDDTLKCNSFVKKYPKYLEYHKGGAV